MADQRAGGISWTEESWNPIRGCSRVSEGCRFCYAERVAARFSWPAPGDGMENLEKGLPPTKAGPYHGLAEMTPAGPRWTGKVAFVDEHLEDPLRWKRPRRIFVNSMSDLFHENVDDIWIEKIILVMAQAPRHTFQVLTKRAARMQEFLSSFHTPKQGGWPLPNVWWGVSVENQAAADERIPLLVDTPAAVRWISAEPLLGPLNLNRYLLALRSEGHQACRGIHWVVAGGESGVGARPMDISWARSIRDQCAKAGVDFFMKQVGGETDKRGSMDDLPEDLRIREYPAMQTVDATSPAAIGSRSKTVG